LRQQLHSGQGGRAPGEEGEELPQVAARQARLPDDAGEADTGVAAHAKGARQPGKVGAEGLRRHGPDTLGHYPWAKGGEGARQLSLGPQALRLALRVHANGAIGLCKRNGVVGVQRATDAAHNLQVQQTWR